jgi:hypothetical protein
MLFFFVTVRASRVGADKDPVVLGQNQALVAQGGLFQGQGHTMDEGLCFVVGAARNRGPLKRK